MITLRWACLFLLIAALLGGIIGGGLVILMSECVCEEEWEEVQ